MHFQEWPTRHRASLPATAFVQTGIADAQPAPGVLDAIAGADVILVAPSNPVVAACAPVVGLSPIIAGAAVRGMADACLAAIGVATSADAVALHYGARSAGGLIDAWLIDESDAALAPIIEANGIRPVVVPLWMRDLATSTQLAKDALETLRR
jgi:LPPG:FO 2-phospho-L-lactate transferase